MADLESYTFHDMTADDRTAVIDIFNYYVTNSFAAYFEEPLPYTAFTRFMVMSHGYPAVTIKDAEGKTVGFAFLRPFRPGSVLRRTAEVTYFIKKGHTGQGLGKKLLNFLVDKARHGGIDKLLVDLSSKNEAGINFHLQNGFQECGRFHNAGRKWGEDFDIVWLERSI